MPTPDEQVIQDGQRAVAVTEVSGDFIYDGGATDAYCIVNNNGTAQRALKVANVGEGGGGGGTVDQTYDPTSTNAQSGTAVAEAVAPALKNTATGTNSLAILGRTGNYPKAVSIGADAESSSEGAISIGKAASSLFYGTSVGVLTSTGQISVAIGSYASAQNATGAIAIGGSVDFSKRTKALATRAIAIGSYGYGTQSVEANEQDCIQLGTGVNNTAKTLQVYEYPLLDGNTGKIPMARLPIVPITQADYDALVSGGTVDANTIYCIIPA